MIRKKGISLVALVITIIVLIILTGAVIATFMEGGIIDRAKETVKRSDYITLREAYDTNYNTKKIEIETGIGGKISNKEILKKTVSEVGMDRDFEFVQYKEILGVTYKGGNEEIQKWLAEILSDVEDNELILVNGYLTNAYLGNGTENLEARIKAQLGDEYSLVGESTGAKVMLNSEHIATVIVFGECDTFSSYIENGDAKIIKNVVYNGKYGELTDAQIQASDVNGDGIISYDDSVIQGMFFVGELSASNFQKKVVLALPKIVDKNKYPSGYMYTWYNEGISDESIGIIAMLKEKGYNIGEKTKKGYPITVKSGTRYKDFENELNAAFGVNNVIKIDMVNEIMNDEDIVTISIPFKISETQYSRVSSIKFKVIIQN